MIDKEKIVKEEMSVREDEGIVLIDEIEKIEEREGGRGEGV